MRIVVGGSLDGQRVAQEGKEMRALVRFEGPTAVRWRIERYALVETARSFEWQYVGVE